MEMPGSDFLTLGGVAAAVATVVGAVWKFMDGNVRHWKELYEAKNAELGNVRQDLENARRDPVDIATRYIAAQDQVLSKQITKLQESIQNLKADIIAKDEKISDLMKESRENEERLVYLREAKENLEQKLSAYEEMIKSLAGRRQLAGETIGALRSNAFRGPDLETRLQEEIDARIRNIDATSFSGTWRAAGQAVQRAAISNAARAQQHIAEKARAQARMEESIKKAMKVDLPADSPPRNDKFRGR